LRSRHAALDAVRADAGLAGFALVSGAAFGLVVAALFMVRSAFGL
jgi:hypothetical protein